MNAEAIVALITVVVIVLGGIAGAFKALLTRDRNAVEAQQKEMMGKLDHFNAELQKALLDQAVLRERVDGAPDWEIKIREMEARLEGQFKEVTAQLREIYALAFKAFQQKQG